MNPTDIKNVLSEIGARPNKKLGQHFLIDASVLKTIVEAADIKPGDHVLEVGPGLGVLTRSLLDREAEVIAIEQDRRFVEYLQQPTPTLPYQGGGQTDIPLTRGTRSDEVVSDRLSIIHGDAATIHWHDLVGDRPWKFVSNLPYSITSLALRKSLWTPKPPERVVVLVQREVAERAIAKSGKTSLLSLMIALSSSSARIVNRVPAGAFYPRPNIESAILQITPMPWPEREKKWGIHPDQIMAVAKKGFAHPRKLLTSNLGLGEAGQTLLVALKITPKARAEDLSPQQWAALTLAMENVDGELVRRA